MAVVLEPHLCKQGRKRPTPVQRQLSRTHAVLGRVIPGGWVPCRGLKWGVSWCCPTTPHSIGDPPRAPHFLLLSSDEMMSCCAAGTNGCIDMRRHALPLGGQVNVEWSRCPCSIDARGNVDGLLEAMWLLCDEVRQVGCLQR